MKITSKSNTPCRVWCLERNCWSHSANFAINENYGTAWAMCCGLYRVSVNQIYSEPEFPWVTMLLTACNEISLRSTPLNKGWTITIISFITGTVIYTRSFVYVFAGEKIEQASGFEINLLHIFTNQFLGSNGRHLPVYSGLISEDWKLIDRYPLHTLDCHL